jgi:hydroxyacylglutathione hydrolase
MKLIPLPAFADNYIWMLHDEQNAWVVDPGDAQPVMQALQRVGVKLEGILVTHHHPDHTGGVNLLRDATGAQVYGPAFEPMPEPLQRMHGGDTVSVLGLNFTVLDVPGHTAGHIAYYGVAAPDEPILFCGDTLFSGGCGRLFEGTAAQMQESLELLAMLPDATRVCCAHEYTLSNLQFALAVEPENTTLRQYFDRAQDLRKRGLPTLPTHIALERKVNPFLRSTQPAIAASVHAYSAQGVERDGVFATLRQWKNEYR